MKMLLASLAALSGAAVLAPAADAAPLDRRAGYHHGYVQAGYWMDRGDFDRMRFRIEQGRRHGDLTRGEAVRLRREVNYLARLQTRYARNGVQPWEARDLRNRRERLSRNIFRERHDFDYRRF